jgi:hypothetical protein
MAVPDFSGYVTKYGLRCTDNRVIIAHAFGGQNGQRIPLVWQHQHDAPDNVLGFLLLHAVDDGVRADGYFNDTPRGLIARKLVKHGDIDNLSIYANQLAQSGLNVMDGMIREGSLVMSGANPGARIDNVNISHSDALNGDVDDEVIIYTGLAIAHGEPAPPQLPAVPPKPALETINPTAVIAHADAPADSNLTVDDVLNSFTEVQRNVVFALLGAALQQSGLGMDGLTGNISDTLDNNKEGGDQVVHRNVFDSTDDQGASDTTVAPVLSHADVKGIMADAMRCGSLKEAVTNYAIKHGIDNIDVLFPDAAKLQDQPDFISRRVEWVAGVLAGTRHSPFARVKTILADITQDDARAKGYIKGGMKKEEFIGVSRRTTTPTTVYKKQKLDRDDVIDITDLDAITFIKGEMRLMLEEEIARAILIGDGRDITDADKVKDPAGAADGAGLRSILNDHDMYVTTVYVNTNDANSTDSEIIDGIVRGMRFYHGTGMPTLYTTLQILTRLVLLKDTLGRRLYNTQAELANAMMVRNIVTVEPMEQVTNLIGVVVNLSDYNVGTDRGGEINTFDDFDIDFNQLKYLIETRLSGALVKYKAALVVMDRASGDTLVDPVTAPTINKTTWVVTIPTLSNVVYKNNDTGATLSAGAQTALAPGATLNVIAVPNSTYYFRSDAEDEWAFYRRPA